MMVPAFGVSLNTFRFAIGAGLVEGEAGGFDASG
jgi:hypothetical protein